MSTAVCSCSGDFCWQRIAAELQELFPNYGHGVESWCANFFIRRGGETSDNATEPSIADSASAVPLGVRLGSQGEAGERRRARRCSP